MTQTTYTGQQGARVQAGPDLAGAAQTRLDLGIAYLQQGNVEQAKFNLQRALQYAPNNPAVHTGFAYFYQRVGDNNAAEQSYLRALSLAPSNADAMNNYGVFLCDQQRYQEADSAFMSAIKQPGYLKIADTYQNAALCAQQNHRNNQANEYYQHALGYNPRNPRLLLDIAELSMKEGKLSAVQSYLVRFAEVANENENSLWLRLQLAKVQGDTALLHQFGTALLKQYPSSQQAKRYLANDY